MDFLTLPLSQQWSEELNDFECPNFYIEQSCPQPDTPVPNDVVNDMALKYHNHVTNNAQESLQWMFEANDNRKQRVERRITSVVDTQQHPTCGPQLHVSLNHGDPQWISWSEGMGISPAVVSE